MSDQLKMHSPNLVDANIEKIAALFPNCVTEAQGENGELKKAVDFDLLKQELSQVLVEGEQERYRLDWVGKKEAILTANAPIAKTLRPCKEESVNFDTTENLFIEGDNLEALKLLQENYLGKVKMIYIDPPYNTGNDFIYEDDFAESTDEFFERSNQVDEEGNRLIANTDSNGRFHSDWLSMMYSRLKLARNLLKEDGVIFISIDDNEISNLEKINNEIFGENNKIGCLIREAIKGGSLSKFFRNTHDYILVYAKNIEEVSFSGFPKEEMILDKEDEFGKYTRGRELNKWGAGSRKEDSPSMWYPIYTPDGEEVYPIRNDGSEGRWRFGKVSMKKLIDEGNVIFEKRKNGTYIAYEKLRGNKSNIIQFISILKDKYINAKATEELKRLFNLERAIFDFSKPVELLEDLMLLADVQSEDIVLDFFGGSGTTLQAVFNHNFKCEKRVKCILVQLDEAILNETEGYKNGFRDITSISKERIRRAGKKIIEDNANEEGIRNLDIGFRVLKIDSTNMKDVYYTPDALKQSDLLDLASNIKEDRTSEDLLFQVMLDWGLELSLPIERKTLAGKEVFYVAGNSLVACFDELTFDVVDEVAKDHPLRFVSAEKAIHLDHDKTNIKERFKQLSPDTEVKFL